MSSPQVIASRLASALAERNGWLSADLARIHLAIAKADPWGLDARASAPEWWAAIGDELRDLENPPWGLSEVIRIADQGASGARPMGIADQAVDLGASIVEDTRKRIPSPRDGFKAWKDRILPIGALALLIYLLDE